MLQADCAPITGRRFDASHISHDRAVLTPGKIVAFSRRGIMAGMALLPIVAALKPDSATASVSNWASVLAQYQYAEDAHRAACAAYGDAQDQYFKVRPELPYSSRFMPNDTTQTFNARWCEVKADHARADFNCRALFRVDETEDEAEAACAAADAALKRVLVTAAPDIEAVIIKLEIASENGLDIEDLAPVLDDLRSLGGLA